MLWSPRAIVTPRSTRSSLITCDASARSDHEARIARTMDSLIETPTDLSSLTILALGEGDFTFSLDLARFLADHNRQRTTRFVPTGLDTLEELQGKYKDTAFVLRQLEKQGNVSSNLSIDIRHGVNAVDVVTRDAKEQIAADVVFFHHPHLGTEDAQRHARFLCHLFHAVKSRWLRSGGLFHLTLASGQFERWNCLASSQRQGFELLDRREFQPPAVNDPQYELRRHQTGKSFRNRTNGQSETMTFAIVGRPRSVDSVVVPIWSNLHSNNESQSSNDDLFSCSLCSKSFTQERSLKEHNRTRHSLCRKRQRQESYTCEHCPDRMFDSEQALQDHVRAKHTAIYTHILPDWSAGFKNTSGIRDQSLPSASGGEALGNCGICGAVFYEVTEMQQHIQSFVPDSSSLPDTDILWHPCRFCRKLFRERRAQLQHENVCSSAGL